MEGCRGTCCGTDSDAVVMGTDSNAVFMVVVVVVVVATCAYWQISCAKGDSADPAMKKHSYHHIWR